MEAYKFLSRDELVAKAAEAIDLGSQSFWRDRHKIKTGTLLDDLYKPNRLRRKSD